MLFHRSGHPARGHPRLWIRPCCIKYVQSVRHRPSHSKTHIEPGIRKRRLQNRDILGPFPPHAPFILPPTFSYQPSVFQVVVGCRVDRRRTSASGFAGRGHRSARCQLPFMARQQNHQKALRRRGESPRVHLNTPPLPPSPRCRRGLTRIRALDRLALTRRASVFSKRASGRIPRTSP